MEYVVVSRVDACTEGELYPPVALLPQRKTVADAHPAAHSGGLPVMVLISVVAVEGEVVVYQSDMCADKAAPTICEILKAQAAGDAATQAIMEDAVRHLGLAIANIDNFVRPDSILIECNYFEHLPNRELLLSVIHKNLYTATPADVKFSFITPDPFSGAKGAAAVAICKDLETYVE